MKRTVVCLMIGGGLALTAAARDIGSDAMPQDLPQIEPANVDSRKVDSMVNFIMGIQEKDDMKGAEMLLKTLRQDPKSEAPLLMLLRRLNTTAVAKKVQPVLAELARKNPDALKLNLAVQLFPAVELKSRELADMALASLNSIKNPAALDEPDLAIVTKLIALVGNRLAQLKDFPAGEALFQRWLAVPRLQKDFQFMEAAAVFYIAAGERCKPQLQKVVTLLLNNFPSPSDPREAARLAYIYERADAIDEAIQVLEKQLAKAPELEVERIQEMLGNLYFWTKRYPEAVVVRRILAERHPDNAKYQLAYAEALLYADSNEAAQGIFARLHQQAPRDMYIHFLYGLACFKSGKYRQAVEILQPLKTVMARQLLANAYEQLNEYEKALDVMLALEKEGLLNRDGFYLYMSLAAKCKRADLLRNCVQMMAKRGWNDAVALNAVGYTLADANIDLEVAEELIRKALKQSPRQVEYLDSMAWVLYRKGEYQAARRYIDQALDASGNVDQPEIADHAGDIYFALRRYEDAVKYWKKALQVYSREVDPAEVLAKINKAESEIAFED